LLSPEDKALSRGKRLRLALRDSRIFWGLCITLILILAIDNRVRHRREFAALQTLASQIQSLGSAIEALGTAVGGFEIKSGAQLEALRTAISPLDRRIADLEQQVEAIAFAMGKPGSPDEIVLSSLDSYESLDQNWKSFADVTARAELPCLAAGRVAVLVTLGQSNAANHGEGLYRAKHDVRNFNLYDGRCYIAADPLLGASGTGGNFATRLGDLLIERGAFGAVVLAPIAMGGSTVEQWSNEGRFNRRILALIRRLYDAGLKPTHILWHQGEANSGEGDANGRQYRKNLLEVVNTFRHYGIEAPFYVALATRCESPKPNAENIRAGQRGTVAPNLHIYAGPDTDALGPEFRDAKICHFTEAGLARHAELWADSILGGRQNLAGPQQGR
jgi:hypothetical protein